MSPRHGRRAWVVADGRVIEPGGKTENAQHVPALAPFTPAVPRAHAWEAAD